jgi:choline dehydrogenase-like flavoprotein
LQLETTAELQDDFAFNPDINSGNPLGIGTLSHVIGEILCPRSTGWTPASIKNGTRVDSSTAYLRKDRRNLSVLIHATATKLLSSRQESGVPVVDSVQFASGSSSQFYTAKARKEIIVSAGVFNTPKLLLLSGIGDAETLKKIGIPPLVHLPSVGRNMSDHVTLENRRATRFHNDSLA